MISTINKAISQKYKLSEKKGIFISVFGDNGKLLISNGVINSNKPIDKTIETLRLGIFAKEEKNIKSIIVDIVIDANQETNANNLALLDVKNFGMFISNIEKTKSGVLLPNTVGIADAKHGLYTLKQKYPDLNGNVLIRTFSTDRIIV